MIIKNVAREIGCSTSPIIWTFGGMDQYRTELQNYAVKELKSRMRTDSSDPVAEYMHRVQVYLDAAIRQSNLLVFLRQANGCVNSTIWLIHFSEAEKRENFYKRVAVLRELPEDWAVRNIQSIEIYIEGVISMILSNTITVSREDVFSMVNEAAEAISNYQKMTTGRIEYDDGGG
ncbi:MAG: hypothetical protein Q4B15_09260 [Lachnospiraceae bacterium]|nr:hypothetical protein [Lachnospiraceae bacterium]